MDAQKTKLAQEKAAIMYRFRQREGIGKKWGRFGVGFALIPLGYGEHCLFTGHARFSTEHSDALLSRLATPQNL
jgi:hypothetical protein